MTFQNLIRKIITESQCYNYKNDEMLLCLPNHNDTEETIKSLTCIKDDSKLLQKAKEKSIPVPRKIAENTNKLLQLIVYMVVERYNGKIIIERKYDGGRYCFPGGHVDLENSINGSIKKELNEEINVKDDDIDEINFIGTIYTGHIEDNNVSDRHIGLCFYVKLNKNYVPSNNEPHKFTISEYKKSDLEKQIINSDKTKDGWMEHAWDKLKNYMNNILYN